MTTTGPNWGLFPFSELNEMIISTYITRIATTVALFRGKAFHEKGLQLHMSDEIDKILQRFNELNNCDSRIMADLVEYDELGLPT